MLLPTETAMEQRIVYVSTHTRDLFTMHDIWSMHGCIKCQKQTICRLSKHWSLSSYISILLQLF